jgi:large subunit ribosomal protein L2
MFKFYSIIRSQAGRNNSGSITVRHRGSGIIPKKSFNFINRLNNFFGYKKYNFNNNNSSVLVNFDKAKGYYNFIMTKPLLSKPDQLYNYKSGTNICNIEAFPFSGPKYVRANYSRAIVVKILGTKSLIKIPSGELRKFKSTCFGFPSINKAFVKKQKTVFKAGHNRNIGIRPHVRGCAINPVDHPHGGRSGESRPSVTPWAKLTKGYRTRFKPKNKIVVLVSVQEFKNKNRVVKL